MSIAVVIVNYHSERHVENCLRSLSEFERQDVVPIIVDNSPPACYDKLRAQFTNVTVLNQFENRGFAAGANIGIGYALEHGAEYICLLNPDTKISADFLTPLVRVL